MKHQHPEVWALPPRLQAALFLAIITQRFWHAQPDGPSLAFIDLLIYLAIAISLVALRELVAPKPRIENAKPAGLGDFMLPTATEGRVQPLVWGTVKVAGPNVTWYRDLSQDPIRQSIKTGLFSKQRVTVGYHYRLGVQMSLCRGSDTAPVRLREILIDDVSAWTGTLSTDGSRADINLPDLFGGDKQGNGGVQASVDFYTGTTTQPVNAYLNDPSRQQVTTAATPTCLRYTGESYVVLRELTQAAATAGDRGAYLGNSPNIASWSFVVDRFPVLFNGQSAGDNTVNGGLDANPINVLYELLTNTDWGFGETNADIAVGAGGSFVAAATTLKNEGNGFSMALTRAMKANDLKQLIEQQIGGFCYVDESTGLWEIKLVREDYTIGSVPQLSEDNCRLEEFARSAWDDTSNQVAVQFTKREDAYKESYALAQDMANAMIRGGGTISTALIAGVQVSYPGVMDSTLAAALAQRDLRALAVPLARATITTGRQVWDQVIGDVVAFSWSPLGISQIPMRIVDIDKGRLDKGEIKLKLVQDVFDDAQALYASPPATGWTAPSYTLSAFPADEQVVIEAPRAIMVRDPEFAGDDTVAQVFAAARRQTNETDFEITQRNSSGTPSGGYADAGTVLAFMRVGELASSLAAGTAIPTTSITVTASPDAQSTLEAAFDDTVTLQDLGIWLSNLILVGSEFMAVKSATTSGADVLLQNVYRGLLDTAQAAHSAGTPVYLVFVGAGLSDTTFPPTNNVDVELRMESPQNRYAGAVTTVALALNKRAQRPYPPSAVFSQLSSTPFNTPNLEGQGSGLNGFGFDTTWRRRRYDNTDEVAELLADQSVSATTEYRVRVFVDPSGANTEVHTSTWATGTGPERITRLEIIRAAAAGTAVRLQVEVRHTINSVVLTSLQNLVFDVVPTSTLTGQHYFGGDLRASDVGTAYTAAATGTYTLTIGAAFTTSNVQARLNGGAWSTVIAAGGTSGTFAVTSGDQIEIRHTVNEAPDPNFVELKNPSSVAVGYGCFSA